MKKLIPAIGMTFLGAALLGTSTFAWFSANKTVTATGMKLQAKADSSLLISNTKESGYSNTMSLENDVSNPNTYLTPTTATFANGAYTFQKLTNTGKELVDINGDVVLPEGKQISEYLEETKVDNYHDDCYLKFEGSKGEDGELPKQNVTFSAKMTSDGSEEIYKAFRVSVVDTEAKQVLYTFSFTSLNTEVKAQTGDTDVTFELTANTPKQIEVYAWLDGDADECVNKNAINGAAYTVALTFQIPSASSK